MRDKIIEGILKHKLIVIIRNVDREQLIPLVEALYDGGIRLIELTFCADGRIKDSEIAENIGILKKAFEGRIHIGAGTVITETQVELSAAAGAEFIISPDTYTPIIERTRALGMVSIPGAITPSEITHAYRAGADFVKLFPISAMGPEYIKSITAPLSHIRLLAVGGIDENNISDYFGLGVKGFGIGGNLVNKSLLAKGDYEAIAKLASRYVKEVEMWQSI